MKSPSSAWETDKVGPPHFNLAEEENDDYERQREDSRRKKCGKWEQREREYSELEMVDKP